MNALRRLAMLGALLLSGAAVAQPTLSINPAATNVAPGASGTLTIDFTGDGTQTGVTFTLLYDINLVPTTTNCVANAPGFANCNDLGDTNADMMGEIAFAIANASPLGDGNFGSIDFMVPGATVPPATFNVMVDGASVNYAPGGNIGTTTGSVITSPAGPGPGILNVQPPTLGLTAEVNGAASSGNITVSNDGAAGDATITPTCGLQNQAGTGTISVGATPGPLAPGASGTVAASCSGTALGTATADYVCTATSSGTPAVTNDTTAITCMVTTGVPAANPAPGSALQVNIGPVVRGSAGSGGVTFSETNNSGGSYDLTCTLDDNGGGAYAITSAAAATGITTATPFSLTFSGQSSVADPQPAGAVTCTYSNGLTGTTTIGLGIALVPEIVPTLSQWGLILLTLILVGFGALQMRRRTNV